MLPKFTLGIASDQIALPGWAPWALTRARAGLIVWATGYPVTFPLLDPELLAAEDNDLPLFRRAVRPDLPGLFFLGLLQPIGAVMPLAEAQAQWIAEILTG